MTTRLNPYLSWRGQAAEAMTFYQSVFGGDLTSNTFADYGGMGVPPDEQDQVMHAQLRVSDSFWLMGADAPSTHPEGTPNGHISISGDEVDTIRGWFEALAVGGHVDVPFEQAPWGDHFGQVKDRFGINWLCNAGTGTEG
jgi:PhnB protein